MSEPAKQVEEQLEELVGTTVAGRYRVERLLGIGGMGAVFQAHHLQLKRDVAIKILHPHLGANEDISRRFDREAHSAARLDHPNIIPVTDFGTTEDGMKFMVMQLVTGVELVEQLTGPLPPLRAIELEIQILRGLEHAHEKGVIHRDLKPENVLVTRDHDGEEVLKLVDFGIAKIVDEPDNDTAKPLTRVGLVFGTPHYMSPEQATGSTVDSRTDVYSAGVILYQMLAGRVPFDHEDPVSLIRMQVSIDPPPLPPSVPDSLQAVVMRMLAKPRDERFSSAREARKALQAVQEQLALEAGVPVRVDRMDTQPVDPRDLYGNTGVHQAIPPTALGSSPTIPPIGDPTRGYSTIQQTPTALLAAVPRKWWYVAGGVLGLLIIIAAWPSGSDGAEDADVGEGSGGSSLLIGSKTEDSADTSGQADDKPLEAIGDQLGLKPGPPEATLIAIDQALTAKNDEGALQLIRPARDQFSDDPQLMWREGKALAMSTKTSSKVTALERYGQAFEKDPKLIENPDFYRELQDLLRNKLIRAQAIDLAVQKLGKNGHAFLLELVNVDDPKKMLGWLDRHRVLDELGRDADSSKLVDWKLNRARDLYQVDKAPTPCIAFNATLDAIAAENDVYYLEHIGNSKLAVPEFTSNDKDDGAMCPTLAAKLEQVRAQYYAAFPEESAKYQEAAKPAPSGGSSNKKKKGWR